MNKELYNLFCKIAGSDNVFTDEPMHTHTTFRVGGAADYYVVPHSLEEVRELLLAVKEAGMPYTVLGNGSNVLVSDKGYRGVIIKLYKNLSDIQIEGTVIRAQAGALLSKTAAKAQKAGLSGFEFAAGIPGTLGGAVVMNAGAYGGEIKDVISHATVIDQNAAITKLSKEELELGYRTSSISRHGWTVLAVELCLAEGNKEDIASRMEELRKQRIAKQPLEFASAGSTFKRPEGHFAGKLIMDAGLRGYSTGGAQVSEKHCGFVINKGNGTASDIYDLICHIQDTVWQKFGVRLEPEVKMLGEF